MKNDKLWQLLLLLALIVIVCSFFTRQLTSSGTLYDYAQENPEIAYAEKETETNNTISSENETDTQAENVDTKTTPNHSIDNMENSTIESDKDNSLDNTTNDSTDVLCGYPTAEAINTSDSASSTDRIIYADGFFYEPITSEIEDRIRGISYPEEDADISITLDELSYVNVLYNDFEGGVKRGEIICNDSIAQDLVEIFEELYRSGYQFEEISLIDKYNGDDTLSMEHNNTSCFNYRIVDGTEHLSKHAYGLAIDINPFYNPYVVFNKDGTGETYISPKGSEIYADRSKDFPYKIDENDLCYKLFIEHGFTWGGNWNSSKDYQHFQKMK